jgi:hypothetical protein
VAFLLISKGISMNWVLIVFQTLLAVLMGLTVLFILSREARKHIEPKSNSEQKQQLLKNKLKLTGLIFWFWFSSIWILTVAPTINWSIFGKWTGLIVYLGLLALFVIVAIVLQWIHNWKSTSDSE